MLEIWRGASTFQKSATIQVNEGDGGWWWWWWFWLSTTIERVNRESVGRGATKSRIYCVQVTHPTEQVFSSFLANAS